jgi:hypothetical protein
MDTATVDTATVDTASVVGDTPVAGAFITHTVADRPMLRSSALLQVVDGAVRSEKPEIKRLAGTEGSFGEQAGLTRDWAIRIIRNVGNYGEISSAASGSSRSSAFRAASTISGPMAALRTLRQSAERPVQSH